MLFAALTFWLLVILFAAWGVHELWSGLVKRRVVNFILLPGTLVAQLGHVLGLLITGNPVNNTQLIGDDEQAEPTADVPDKQRLPIIGPIVVGLLPLAACAVSLGVVSRYWGWSVVRALEDVDYPLLAQRLPTSLHEFWQLLHSVITLLERLVDAIQLSDLPQWATVLFLYLSVCLTVRMAPFQGNRRGTMGAIVLAGVVTSVVGTLVPAVRDAVRDPVWPILSFSVGVLLFLLLLSLVVAGIVGLVRVLASRG